MLDDADKFDATFFGLTPRDAELTDPQHRVFLECAWHALEDAGLDPERYPGSVGVFAGSSLNTYLLDHPRLVTPRCARRFRRAIPGRTATRSSSAATRTTSPRGPELQTLTSAARASPYQRPRAALPLVGAVVQAVNALLGYQCDAALAGGDLDHFPATAWSRLSRRRDRQQGRHCRPFDAEAKGTIFGSGCGRSSS